MEKTKKIRKKIVSFILSLVVLVFIAFVAYFGYCNINGKIAFIGGRSFIKIVSSSMEPTIPTGEYIVVEEISENKITDLKVNDVIVFYSRDPQIFGKLNTHRIVKIVSDENGTHFVTKGDNNPVNDELTTSSDDVVARYVTNSTFLTRFAGFFSHKIIFLLLVLIPSAVLVIVCFVDLIKKSKAVKMDMLVKQEVEKLKNADQNDDIDS